MGEEDLGRWADCEADQCRALTPNAFRFPPRRCGLLDDGHRLHRERVYGLTWIAGVRAVGCPACAPVAEGVTAGPGCEQCEGAGWVWIVPDHLSEDQVARQIAQLTRDG